MRLVEFEILAIRASFLREILQVLERSRCGQMATGHHARLRVDATYTCKVGSSSQEVDRKYTDEDIGIAQHTYSHLRDHPKIR